MAPVPIAILHAYAGPIGLAGLDRVSRNRNLTGECRLFSRLPGALDFINIRLTAYVVGCGRVEDFSNPPLHFAKGARTLWIAESCRREHQLVDAMARIADVTDCGSRWNAGVIALPLYEVISIARGADEILHVLHQARE